MALVRRLNSLFSRSIGLVVRNTVQYVGSNWKNVSKESKSFSMICTAEGNSRPHQLGNARLRVVRIDPILIRSLVGSLTNELRQLLPCGRSNPLFVRQPPEKLLIVLARLPSHNRAQARVRLQGRGIDAHRLPLQQAL